MTDKFGPLKAVEDWENQWVEMNLPRQSQIPDFLKNIIKFETRQVDRIFKDILPRDPEMQFCEIGCGSGRWLVYFKRNYGYKVFGVDYSSAGCDLAKWVCTQAGVSADIRCDDVFSLIKKDEYLGKYDVVFSDGFVEHFREPREVILHLSHLVKPGGKFITMIPNLNGIQGSLTKILAPDVLSRHKIITLTELKQFYEQANMDNIKIYTVGSIMPKVIGVQSFPAKSLRTLLILLSGLLDVAGLSLEGPTLSRTLIVVGKKLNG